MTLSLPTFLATRLAGESIVRQCNAMQWNEFAKPTNEMLMQCTLYFCSFIHLHSFLDKLGHQGWLMDMDSHVHIYRLGKEKVHGSNNLKKQNRPSMSVCNSTWRIFMRIIIVLLSFIIIFFSLHSLTWLPTTSKTTKNLKRAFHFMYSACTNRTKKR